MTNSTLVRAFVRALGEMTLAFILFSVLHTFLLAPYYFVDSDGNYALLVLVAVVYIVTRALQIDRQLRAPKEPE